MKYLLHIFVFFLLFNYYYCSFQSKLFNEMNKGKIGKNLIISPLSIFQVLSLTSNGAREKTLLEMLELLEYDSLYELNEINYEILSISQNFTTVDIANAVMTKFTPLNDFIDTALKYLAPIETLKSVEQVNNWCSEKTHGKINKILDSLNPATLMILLNAVYFKGEWSVKFEERLTQKLPFYNLGNKEIKVDTMDQIDHFRYYGDKTVKAIELRFKRDFMSAIIILPANGTDINKYITTLSNNNDEYNQLISKLKYSKVHLQLPKFEINFSENLNEILMNLGMYNAFNSDVADFTGLRKEGNIYIDKVIHKTYLKVNEQGTEAAAVTAVILNYGSALPVQEIIYEMKVNRPFLFLLKNDKLPAGHDLLFMAKIEKLE